MILNLFRRTPPLSEEIFNALDQYTAQSPTADEIEAILQTIAETPNGLEFINRIRIDLLAKINSRSHPNSKSNCFNLFCIIRPYLQHKSTS